MKRPEFTKEQEYWLCEILGKWYLSWKHRIAKGEHLLGHATEELKGIMCGAIYEENLTEKILETAKKLLSSMEELNDLGELQEDERFKEYLKEGIRLIEESKKGRLNS